MGRKKIIEERDNGLSIVEYVEEAGGARLLKNVVYQEGTPEYKEKKEAVDKL